MLVQALIEREIRMSMQREGIADLPIYPEDRPSKRPTCEQILRLFTYAERHVLLSKGQPVRTFEPELTELQSQVLKLLGVPRRRYAGES